MKKVETLHVTVFLAPAHKRCVLPPPCAIESLVSEVGDTGGCVGLVARTTFILAKAGLSPLLVSCTWAVRVHRWK